MTARHVEPYARFYARQWLAASVIILVAAAVAFAFGAWPMAWLLLVGAGVFVSRASYWTGYLTACKHMSSTVEGNE